MNSHIVPEVEALDIHSGSFILSQNITVEYLDPSSRDLAGLLAEYLRPATGFEIPVAAGSQPQPGSLTLILEPSYSRKNDKEFADESYRINVTSDGVRLEAAENAGLARAIQTLRQLMPPEIFAQSKQNIKWEIPCARITDKPQFKWRGMHLDVARHFFTVEQVCRFIDLIALHRYNRLHLHLTDDQGWRVEILKYPKLTDIGSKRDCTLIGSNRTRPHLYDDKPHCGFFTQDDIRQIVTYAARRHIVVMPEIDMPGHTQAAIAAYPELGNTNACFKTLCHWGISNHILNVEPETIDFMRNVLSEVIDLFPSRFIHIGGDEAPKYEWAESRKVQDRMRELSLSGEDQLQSWFIKQMGEFIHSHGRRMIGWDEILEGGLAPEATVMSWRGEDGGITAAKAGHDVVMTPCQFVYFDFYQADPIKEEPIANANGCVTSLGKVYAFEPIPSEIPEDKRHHILGGQGQLWTEYISTVELLDYMAFPRTCALAEALWSPPEKKNFKQFLARLSKHRKRLAHLGCQTCL